VSARRNRHRGYTMAGYTMAGYAMVGYTMVEVMMAMALLAVGATGIMAMQKTAIVGNVTARRVVMANMISQTWAERLQMDAATWNQPAASSDLLTDTTWLGSTLFTLSNNTMTTWFSPAEVAGPAGLTGSSSADFYGNDIFGGPLANNPAAFCTHIRLTKLYDGDLIRAEIRTFWSRTNQGVDTQCALAAANFNPRTAHIQFGFVYVTTAIKRRELEAAL